MDAQSGVKTLPSCCRALRVKASPKKTGQHGTGWPVYTLDCAELEEVGVAPTIGLGQSHVAIKMQSGDSWETKRLRRYLRASKYKSEVDTTGNGAKG